VPDLTFDVVLATFVLETICPAEKRYALLRQMVRALRQGGVMGPGPQGRIRCQDGQGTRPALLGRLHYSREDVYQAVHCAGNQRHYVIVWAIQSRGACPC